MDSRSPEWSQASGRGTKPYSRSGPSPRARAASHLSPPSSRLFDNTFPIIPRIFRRPTTLFNPFRPPTSACSQKSARVVALACASRHAQPRRVIRLVDPPLAVPVLSGVSTMAPSPVRRFFDFYMICFFVCSRFPSVFVPRFSSQNVCTILIQIYNFYESPGRS